MTLRFRPARRVSTALLALALPVLGTAAALAAEQHPNGTSPARVTQPLRPGLVHGEPVHRAPSPRT
ncbi:hypothetical protein CFP65_0910 [Kitasatospora sp. MMS16-BH015]|uniref:hypothetical protein n=1 Tax=Kitasatospora sp. MMS16-BH015 TaxID=2018025 RepID=UPI000CA28DE1|nr:hypothetical protein [Kitasatospora sp. MMS16-BH015]AUG75831.1 hypothetical protein CFP65_0910 [Kitasatospora sp. MMS16-BH015]